MEESSEKSTVCLHFHAIDYEKTSDRTDCTADHVECLSFASNDSGKSSGTTILVDAAESADDETGDDHVKSGGPISEEDSSEGAP